MKGQWIGKFYGTSSGIIIVNIDEVKGVFKGNAYLSEDDRKAPDTVVSLDIPKGVKSFKIKSKLILVIDRHTGMLSEWETVREKYDEGVSVSKWAEISGSWDGDNMVFDWHTDIGVKGFCKLNRSLTSTPSALTPLQYNWDQFKASVSTLNGKSYLFRGQKSSWKLRASFYREGRYDLSRYLNNDVPDLYRYLSSKTRHLFNLEIASENGAFFNMLQHHGYPTPLLDWTYSPYIAAFFAYRGISKSDSLSAGESERVRILYLNKDEWQADSAQYPFLISSVPHLSIQHFVAIDNDRVIPQQAVSTATNVDDIESFIKVVESINNKEYLSAIDLPVSERNKVLQDLAYMGITAGSMFPGLDGACEEMKLYNFDL